MAPPPGPDPPVTRTRPSWSSVVVCKTRSVIVGVAAPKASEAGSKMADEPFPKTSALPSRRATTVASPGRVGQLVRGGLEGVAPRVVGLRGGGIRADAPTSSTRPRAGAPCRRCRPAKSRSVPNRPVWSQAPGSGRRGRRQEAPDEDQGREQGQCQESDEADRREACPSEDGQGESRRGPRSPIQGLTSGRRCWTWWAWARRRLAPGSRRAPAGRRHEGRTRQRSKSNVAVMPAALRSATVRGRRPAMAARSARVA